MEYLHLGESVDSDGDAIVLSDLRFREETAGVSIRKAFYEFGDRPVNRLRVFSQQNAMSVKIEEDVGLIRRSKAVENLLGAPWVDHRIPLGLNDEGRSANRRQALVQPAHESLDFTHAGNRVSHVVDVRIFRVVLDERHLRG